MSKTDSEMTNSVLSGTLNSTVDLYVHHYSLHELSARQHTSYGDCLEVKTEYYQNCYVLDCVTQCSQSAAHFYYSAAALHAMQSAVIPAAIPSVRPSVCPSVTRWYPIQTNEHRITRSSL